MTQDQRINAQFQPEMITLRAEGDAADDLFISGPIAVVSWRPADAGGISAVSPNFTAQFGYSTEALLTSSYLDLIVPEDRDRVLATLQAPAGWYSGQYRLRHADGRHCWVHDDTQRSIGADGLPACRSYLHDITARRQAEDALKVMRERMEIAIHGADLGTYDWHMRTGEELFNERLVAMLGYTLDEVSQQITWWNDIAHPDDLPVIQHRIGEHTRGLTPIYESEHRLKAKDGSWVWVLDRGKIIEWDADGAPLRMAGTHLDITARKHAEEVLAAETEWLAVTLRSIGDGVITTDTAGRVMQLNHVAEQLTGWTQPEAAGRPLQKVFTIINQETRQPCASPVEPAIREETVEVAPRHVLLARDGREYLIADSCAPIRDQQSQVIGTVLVFRDVTEESRLQAELQRHARMESVGLLAGGIAHDFNNLLMAIVGNLNLGQMWLEHGKPAEVQQALRDAETAAMRARSLTQQLLTFARGGEPVRVAVSVRPLLQEVRTLTLSGSRHQARIEADALWPIFADNGQLVQALSNLLLNADQAMELPGEIRLHAANVTLAPGCGLPLPPGPYVQLAITDQGVGIPREHHEKIFEPFFTTKPEGTGLGLASVYSIIKAHQGHITVDSTPGHGSTFTLYLPAMPDEAAVTPVAAVSAPPPASPASMLRILALDDEAMILTVLSKGLTQQGYAVHAVGDCASALTAFDAAVAEGRPFDLLILDLTIPGDIGGQAVVAQLRRRGIPFHAIASSGYATDPVLANYRDYGFDAILAKPYTLVELTTLIASLTQAKN